ncbi:DUF6370 family protein [Polaribacter sp.]|uniref:DUF6370 family protein n=1 Tax=Polaribacter sp. TaxID=1920175 RepID=UPI003F6B8172
MKKLIILSLLVFASCKTKMKVAVAEADIACGQCQFDLEGEEGCSLAVKVLDKAYFVDGFNIDDFGDAHDETKGFCNVVRTGKIAGTIEDGRFKADIIELKK